SRAARDRPQAARACRGLCDREARACARHRRRGRQLASAILLSAARLRPRPGGARRARAPVSGMSARVTSTYDVVTRRPDGQERVHDYATSDGLEPGEVLGLRGRYWLVEAIEPGERPRAFAKPARYRLRLRHPDGREEL